MSSHIKLAYVDTCVDRNKHVLTFIKIECKMRNPDVITYKAEIKLGTPKIADSRKHELVEK